MKTYPMIAALLPVLLAAGYIGLSIKHFSNPESQELTEKLGKAFSDRFERVEDFDQPLAIFPTVFWEPLDTTSLRRRIREKLDMKEKTVLEIGTGSGLIALCCLQAGAREVTATDVNPQAVACAQWNARNLGFEDRLKVKLIQEKISDPYHFLADETRFDYIISNPPWEDGVPTSMDQFALYDPSFHLLDNIISKGRQHLVAPGELYLTYGCKTAIRRIAELAEKDGWKFEILDERTLDDVEEVFLPGMLIRLTCLN